MKLIRPSPTLAITARAAAMRAEGRDVISFAAGEPDFKTPDEICEAATQAMASGFTKYTAGRGIAELRDAIAEKLRRENLIDISGTEVIVTCGAKHALFNALSAIVEPDDEIIIITPFWMTYADQVRLLGGVPVFAEARPENGFIPLAADVERHLTPRTRAIMMCTPNNPSGAVWTESTIREIAEVALAHNLWLISDEVYEKLIYEGEHFSPAALRPDFAERTITIGSFSKTYSMTGWRVGYMAGPKRAIDAMACVQDQISHPTSFAMKAALTALRLGANDLEAMKAEFVKRRNLMFERVAAIPGVVATLPPGAFYVFADFSSFCGSRFPDDMVLAEYLLAEAGVAVIPGAVFACPGYLRLSYTASQAEIAKGMGRVAEALCSVRV
jgi:aspartate aminotransferase